jgi:cytochrome c553
LLTAVFTVSAQINNTPTATTANTDVTFLPANSSENMLQSKMSADEIVKTNCSTCHDVDGLSVAPIYPALAGQHVAYIEKQLISFKQEGDDRRENAIMRGMAAGLTTQNITALAQYFSARSPRKGLAKNTENLEFGRKLWRGGNVHFHIASCTGCHGPNGLGIPSLFPRLAGQNTEYTTTQLTAFQKQTRTNDQNSMMRRLTERMTEKDIAALANFMEGLR